jgi:hypothetical protein
MDDSIEVSEIGTGQPVIEKAWGPTAKQAVVLSIPDTVFEGLGGGSAGGGKTDLGLMIPLARQFTEHPKFKGLVMRRTLADLEKELIPRQQEWYAPSGGTYNETKKVWKFPTGAKIQNGFAEREKDVRKYDSAEYNYVTGMKLPTSQEHNTYILHSLVLEVHLQTYRPLSVRLQTPVTLVTDSLNHDS